MKKIIIIAPFYPPSALPPSLRVRLLVNHLKEFGYEPIVITVNQKSREDPPDNWLVENTRRDFKIIEIKALNQKWTRKLGLGDLGIRMLPFLFTELIKICIKEKPAIILYPVPPWFILIAGPIFKFLFRVPYAIDFIDPWYYDLDIKQLRKKDLKFRINRIIAQILDGWVSKHAFIIFSVSEGINESYIKRYKFLNEKIMAAIPYGVEISDYNALNRIKEKTTIKIIRYVGAVWDDAYPVLSALMEAFDKVLSTDSNFKIEFYGTSYAGKQFSKPQVYSLIKSDKLKEIVSEDSQRVPYQEAVELTFTADINILFGGMKSYYAASKLMGLIASQKPFIAFMHRESYPAEFLTKLNYKYLIKYSSTLNDEPVNKIDELTNKIKDMLQLNNFEPILLDQNEIKDNTAYGMTLKFVNGFNQIINRKE